MRWVAGVNLEDEEAGNVVAGLVALAARAAEPPTVDLVYVATPGGAPSWITDPLSREALAKFANESRATDRLQLDALHRKLPESMRGGFSIEEGKPATVLADQAKNASLIALAGRRRGALDRLLLGSVAAKVARTVDVPVLVIPGGANPAAPTGRALFGVNLRAQDAGVGLDEAARWADRLGLALDLVHVDHERLHVPYVLDPEVRQRLDQEWETLRDRDVTTLQDLLRRVPATRRGNPRVEEGEPSDMLCELADAYDLVMVATHARTGMERLMVGSVAERIIPKCARPVLLLRATA